MIDIERTGDALCFVRREKMRNETDLGMKFAPKIHSGKVLIKIS